MSKCMRCASSVDVNLEKCTECGLIYCFLCNEQSGYGGTECPDCGGAGTVYKELSAGPDGQGDPQPHG